MSTVAWSPQERALRHVAALSSGGPLDRGLRLTMNFHPDRMTGDRPILLKMAEDGVYRSQFVTGTSNGGLTAHPGGDRWRWENRIFGGAYDQAAAGERPVYGALNYRRDPVGGAPRFGSSHFRLTIKTLARATFCYPDSSTYPSAFGVANRFSLLELAEADGLDALDGHVEAQIHGPVRFDCDVEALVLDPNYRGTAVEDMARRIHATLSGIPASDSPWITCDATRTTGDRSTSIQAPRSRSTAGLIPGSSEMLPTRAATTHRRSRRSGIAWRASARHLARTLKRGTRFRPAVPWSRRAGDPPFIYVLRLHGPT